MHLRCGEEMQKAGNTLIDQSFSELSCPVCNSDQLELFLGISAVPVFCNLLFTSQKEALECKKGDIKLAFCKNCGHIFNAAFDPNLIDYTQVYENPLEYSPRFQAYSKALANLLIQRYALHEKDIISIGCGKGFFLSRLCEFGNNRGVGFDPSIKEADQLDVSKKIKLIKDYYSEQYANYPCDLVVCRHVLEHIYNPKNFLQMLHKTLSILPDVSVFFEVPNALNIFKNFFIWDIIYEHYSYFTPSSLARLFTLSKFSISDISEFFESQFLGINATLNQSFVSEFSEQRDQIDQIALCIARFAETYNGIVDEWKHKLEQRKADEQRVVIWGTGSKGVSFLNTVKNSHIEYAVDINPEKQGKYVAGTAQRIVSPHFLKTYNPNLVVVMNPIYKQEIKKYLDSLSVSARIEYPLPFFHESTTD
jgi:2-polyprenyl-3-methyl-5-hydroxy-6-metoxy-1,4-benzoquinol methylase